MNDNVSYCSLLKTVLLNHRTSHIALKAVLAVCVVCLVLNLTPQVFISSQGFHEESAYYRGTKLFKALQRSAYLKSAHGCLIASTLPLVFDTALDLHVKWSRGRRLMDLGSSISAMFIFCNIVPSSVFFAFVWTSTTSPHVAIVYVAMSGTLAIVITTCWITLLGTLKIIPGIFLVLQILMLGARTILVMGNLLNPGHPWYTNAGNILIALVYVNWFVISAIWIRDLLERKRDAKAIRKPLKIPYAESTAIMYSFLFLIWAIALGMTNTLTNVTDWVDANESMLTAYVYVQAILVIPSTILPGRMARAEAIIAENTLAQKQSYVRFVSHEIRSPLSVVSAGLELVQKDIGTIIDHNGSGSEELRAVLELTQDMSEAAETAMNFVNDLLHYESMDAGLFTIETSQVMPDSLIKATTLNIIAKRNNLNLVVVQPREIPESCFVMADLNRIDQVIRNLVVNACKFTSSGGTVTVETSIINEVMKQPQGQALAPHAEICGSVRVKVCDDGVGISKENQTKLFKQFVQFNRNELQGGGGSGLGLWIARTIVNLHFGELAFESEGIGRGSSFFFELPLFKNTSHVSIPALHPAMSGIQVHPEPENRAMMTTSAGAETKNCSLQSARDDEAPPVIEFGSTEQDNTLSFDTLPPISFMIVDDLPMNRKILRRMIESEPSLRGCTILDVEDGCEVVKVMSVENFPVDRSCIFMDSIMKYVHGPEVVRDLRNRGFKGVIIGVTGNAMQHDIDEFVGCGLDRLILKPLKRDILMSALESVGLIRDTKKIYESPTGASKYP